MRVLKWILGRLDNQAGGSDHVFGISPRYEDLDWQGLDFGADRFQQVMASDSGAWRAELALHDELFERLAGQLPGELPRIRDSWAASL
jgi:phosphoenolpyruvate carboxykinase (GTP)